MSIEVYLLGFFFGAHSTFKGRFRSIFTMIRDQSCLSMIAIESRMQGDHEKLTNSLQLLSLFTIQSKVKFTKEEHHFYRKFHRENRGLSDSLKDNSMAEIAQLKWAMIP